MRVLEKTVTLGEMKFKVATDRDIAVKAFEEYPDLIEYLVNKENEIGNDDKSLFLKAIKNKELSTLFEMEEKFAKLIEFALPLMLKKANDESDAMEIIKYANENNVSTEFNSGMLEFLMEGFTLRELAKKPKIKFSMN